MGSLRGLGEAIYSVARELDVDHQIREEVVRWLGLGWEYVIH